MRQHFERVEEAAVRRRSQQARVQAVADGVRALAIIWVLAAAFMLQLPAADAAACLAVVGLLVQRLRELAGVWDRHAAWVTAKPRLLAGLGGGAGGAVGARGRKSAGSGAEPEGALIELRKVGAGPLQAWSQALYRGDKVCLRGASGSGKTTLLRLLAGSIEPQAGRLQRRPDPAWRGRQWIAHIEAQGPVLSGSLRRALTLGSRPRPSDARILEVVQQLGLHNTLERMGGLDGRVLWSGRNLSDYERRRLLLARAMLATMPVVLIDDLGLGSDPGLAQAMQRWLLSSAATVVWVGFDGVDAGQQARGWDLGPAPRGDTAVVEGQAAETGAEAALSDKPG
jgi:ATP-binding cassette subfamily B protein/ATP-binding cassette subfamily C protein CydC